MTVTKEASCDHVTLWFNGSFQEFCVSNNTTKL